MVPKKKKNQTPKNSKFSFGHGGKKQHVQNNPQEAAKSPHCLVSSLSTAEIKIDLAECITSSKSSREYFAYEKKKFYLFGHASISQDKTKTG